jgi:hypothetical protein
MKCLRAFLACFLAASSALTLASLGCGSTKETSDGGPDGAPDASAMMLTVSGAQSPLTPVFSPDIFDYYVRCSAGTNDLTVKMTAAPGGETQLVQPTKSASKPEQSVAVMVAENQAIVASFTSGGTSTPYWVRCLPHDFQTISVTAYPEAGPPAPGYYLLGPATATDEGQGVYAMAVDTHGVPVWYHPVGSSAQGVGDVDNVVDGSISFNPTAFTSILPFELDPLASQAVTNVSPAGDSVDEHELQVLKNGDFLAFSYVIAPGFDLTGLEIPAPMVDGGFLKPGKDSYIQDCVILEFDKTGTISWTWTASEHFDPAKVSLEPSTGFGAKSTGPGGMKAYDVFHCNSISIDPANENLLVSAAATNSVFYVERASGKVLWKLGGTNESLDVGTTYVRVDGQAFKYQHDARLLPGWSSTCSGGAGQVSLLDDEFGNTSGHPRALIYDVVVGGGASGGCGPGSPPGQATSAWEFDGSGATGVGGSVRITAENTRVIGWGASTPTLTEVDVKGHKLLDLQVSLASYRAIKIPAAEFEISVLRTAAGK